MRRLFVAALLGIAALAGAQYYGPKSVIDPGAGQRVLKASASEIRVDQKLNDSVPLDLQFTDAQGKKVVLRDLINGKPVILMPVFYECAGVCNLELIGMADALRGIKNDSAGEDFEVVTFTIKPTETVEMAAARKEVILDMYNRRGAEKGWHFLVGDYKTIRKLTDAVGFEYTYDESTGAVQHPACAVVLTPQGQISKYFLETEYPAQLLLDALKEADKGNIGVKVESESFWNCVEFDPVTGQRSLNVIKILNIAAVFTLVALALSVVYMSVKYKVKSVGTGGTGA